MTGRVVDEGSLTLNPGQIPITDAWNAPHTLMCKEKLQSKLQELEDRFQMLWDREESCYKKWYDFKQPMRIPSQHLAFQQLKFRYERHEPLLVALVAPAGFGKSELISAWLHWIRLKGQTWEVCATTGVAAVQMGGCTLHHLLMCRTDGTTDVVSDTDQRKKLQRIQGLAIDEAMMVEEKIMLTLMSVLQQVPLMPELRRKNALPKFGYRDVIIGGDLRQLPPASPDATVPFWARDLCYEDFEFFVLAEDRRHEKDPQMKRIKEMLAWGGICDAELRDPGEPWPVHDDVKQFVLEGYRRGLTLDASNVDLDTGIALFALRKDARPENKRYVHNWWGHRDEEYMANTSCKHSWLWRMR